MDPVRSIAPDSQLNNPTLDNHTSGQAADEQIIDPQNVWQVIADTVITLIQQNRGEIGVPDLVSVVAQYAHFVDRCSLTGNLFQQWLDNRTCHCEDPFIIFARVPQQQVRYAKDESDPEAVPGNNCSLVGGQETPWPAFSVAIVDLEVRTQLLDERVRDRFQIFCKLLADNLAEPSLLRVSTGGAS